MRGAALAFALVVAASPVAAGTAGPHIVDPEGDANGLAFPYAPGGVVGNTQRELFPDDPLGPGTPTGPATIPAADIVSVTFETPYIAVPIGEDGIDYRQTGFRVRFRTAATPASVGPTTSYDIGTYLPPGTVGCRLFFNATFPGAPSGGAPTARASVGGSADGCWAGDVTINLPAGLTVTTSPPGLVIDVPIASVSEELRPMFEEGSGVLQSPAASTSVGSFVPRVDATLRFPDFLIGSDMPPDVPCTKGCPS
ncbi:MAG TPA: hypothetical protein VGB28_02555 [Actinomycetota bacterium]|jgi:hypothetical protein